jgi:hypothetical protein
MRYLPTLSILLAACGETLPTRPPEVNAQNLLALTAACDILPGSTPFATDEGEPSNIDICRLNGAFWWRADMDIDCDGGKSIICRNDPAFQPETSITDSRDKPLDASKLPFVVVPLPSNGFDYVGQGIELGGVVAVIVGDQLQFGVFGDEGPEGIIGEASFAMAELFGIDPDPVTGGSDSGATYIVFTGQDALIDPPESEFEAETKGIAQVQALLQEN